VISLIYYIFLQFGGKIPFIKDNKRYRNQGEDDVIDVEIIEHSLLATVAVSATTQDEIQRFM